MHVMNQKNPNKNVHVAQIVTARLKKIVVAVAIATQNNNKAPQLWGFILSVMGNKEFIAERTF